VQGRRVAAGALNGREGADVTSALLALATDADADVRMVAAGALEGREGADVTSALLALATYAREDVRKRATEALVRRRDSDILVWACRRWHVGEPLRLPRQRRDLAAKVVDHLYVLLDAEKRPAVLRRLGKLARTRTAKREVTRGAPHGGGYGGRV
jgi:hypothetical protein